MNPVIQLTVERGQHLTTAEMFMNAGIVILVVFGVLLLMYILISISGKIIQAITSIGSKKEKKAEPTPAAAPASGEEFSSGALKLKNCDEKTAAMIMAIVADDTGIPLNELVFKSIKLVEKK